MTERGQQAVTEKNVISGIITIHVQKGILGADLAILYDVVTKILTPMLCAFIQMR